MGDNSGNVRPHFMKAYVETNLSEKEAEAVTDYFLNTIGLGANK